MVAALYFLTPKKSKNKNRLPQPKGFFEVFSSGLYGGNAPYFYMRVSREEGLKCYSVPIMFGMEFIVIADAKVARRILDNPASKKWVKGYQFVNRMAKGDTFFATEAPERYKHVRKSTLQAFASQNIQNWDPMLNKCLQDWIGSVQFSSPSSSTVIDIAEEMQRLTVSVIASLGFSCTLTNDEIELGVKSLQLAYREFAQMSQKYPQRRLLGGLVYPEVRRAHQAAQDLKDLVRKIRQRFLENPPPTGGGKPILHYILQDEGYQDDEERIRDLLVFFAAGFDTTAHTISFTMLELAKNPEIQGRLREELRKLPIHKRRDCLALKHCIREGMRLHPTAAIGGLRVTSEDIELESGCVIEKGSITSILNLALQRDADVYENPDDFLPRRWENTTDAMNLSWISFGTGRRSCVGQALALAELQLVIGTLIADYEWTVEDEGHANFTVTLKTIGTKLKVTKVI